MELELPVPLEPIVAAPPMPPEEPLSHQNPVNVHDVNGDGSVSSIDALLIINRLDGGGPVVLTNADPVPPYLDVDGDGAASSVDAELVIAFLNQ